MAASSSLTVGGGGKCCGGGYEPWRLDLIANHQARTSFMVTMINHHHRHHHNKPRKGGVFAAISSASLQSSSSTTSIMQRRRQYSITHKQDREQQPPPPVISHEKLDEWMREAVEEIVKNVRQAPLLLHVYGDGSDDDDKNNKGKEKTTSLEVEKGVKEEIWADVLEKKPEGVIFVERIEGAEAEEAEEEVVVGVVVQGRGGGRGGVGPLCYLLKMNTVGTACYFCLVRVKSFRETAKKQLQDCWLLRNLNNSYHSW